MAKLDLAALSNVAERAADAAADVIRDALATGDWAVRVKADESPVTDVDVAAERAIRAVLEAATPEAAFFGEETGRSDGRAPQGDDPTGASGERDENGGARLRWLVDPIDGTKSFVRGLPFYSTQIALEADGELVVGVSNAPAFGERLVATAGGAGGDDEAGGAVRLNGRDVRASSVERIDDAFLSSGNLASLARDSARWARYGDVVARVRRVRGYGDFCHYHQLASGGCDLLVESDVNILDIAALKVAVRAAGGVITDLDGRAIDEGTTSVLAAATPALHAEALSALNRGR